jgi:hypothetical protein
MASAMAIAGRLILGRDVPGFDWVLLLALAFWCYGRMRQIDEGGLAPRNDLLPNPDVGVAEEFVAPKSLAVLSMEMPEADPVDVVVWLPPMRSIVTGILSSEHVVGRLARSRKDGGSIEPVNFIPHDFLCSFCISFWSGNFPRVQAFRRRADASRRAGCITLTRACSTRGNPRKEANPTTRTSSVDFMSTAD